MPVDWRISAKLKPKIIREYGESSPVCEHQMVKQRKDEATKDIAAETIRTITEAMIFLGVMVTFRCLVLDFCEGEIWEGFF